MRRLSLTLIELIPGLKRALIDKTFFLRSCFSELHMGPIGSTLFVVMLLLIVGAAMLAALRWCHRQSCYNRRVRGTAGTGSWASPGNSQYLPPPQSGWGGTDQDRLLSLLSGMGRPAPVSGHPWSDSRASRLSWDPWAGAAANAASSADRRIAAFARPPSYRSASLQPDPYSRSYRYLQAAAAAAAYDEDVAARRFDSERFEEISEFRPPVLPRHNRSRRLVQQRQQEEDAGVRGREQPQQAPIALPHLEEEDDVIPAIPPPREDD